MFVEFSNFGAQISIGEKAIVFKENFTAIGRIIIGNETVIHPSVSIIAEAGPIFIGEGNIFEENSIIHNRNPSNHQSKGNDPIIMTIGSYNHFEVGSQSSAIKIGDHNTIRTKARLAASVQLTNGCVIGEMCSLMTNEVLPENTIVLNADGNRRLMAPPTDHTFDDEIRYYQTNFRRTEHVFPDGSTTLQ